MNFKTEISLPTIMSMYDWHSLSIQGDKALKALTFNIGNLRTAGDEPDLDLWSLARWRTPNQEGYAPNTNRAFLVLSALRIRLISESDCDCCEVMYSVPKD